MSFVICSSLKDRIRSMLFLISQTCSLSRSLIFPGKSLKERLSRSFSSIFGSSYLTCNTCGSVPSLSQSFMIMPKLDGLISMVPSLSQGYLKVSCAHSYYERAWHHWRLTKWLMDSSYGSIMRRKNQYLNVFSSTKLLGEGEVGSLFQSKSCRNSSSLLQITQPISFLKSFAKVRSCISCCTCSSFQTIFCLALRSSRKGRPSCVTSWLTAAIALRLCSFSVTSMQSLRVLSKYALNFNRNPYQNYTSGGHLVTYLTMDKLYDLTFFIMCRTYKHIYSERSNLPLNSLICASIFYLFIIYPLSSRLTNASYTQYIPVFILRLTDSLKRGKRSQSQFRPTPVNVFLMYYSCGSGLEKKELKKPPFCFTLPSFIFCTSSLEQLKLTHPSQSSNFSSSFSFCTSNYNKNAPIFYPRFWQCLVILGCGVLLQESNFRAAMYVLFVNLAKKKVATIFNSTRLIFRQWAGKPPCSSTCPSIFLSSLRMAGKLLRRGRRTLFVKALSRRERDMGLSRSANNRSVIYFRCPSSSPYSIPLVNSYKKTAICRSVRYPLPTCFSLMRAVSCNKHWRAVTLTNSYLWSAEARVTTAEKRGKEGQRELQKSFMSELLP